MHTFKWNFFTALGSCLKPAAALLLVAEMVCVQSLPQQVAELFSGLSPDSIRQSSMPGHSPAAVESDRCVFEEHSDSFCILFPQSPPRSECAVSDTGAHLAGLPVRRMWKKIPFPEHSSNFSGGDFAAHSRVRRC